MAGEVTEAAAPSVASQRPWDGTADLAHPGAAPWEPDGRAAALLESEPSLARLVRLARSRLGARQVWLFGSRARGDARPDSDWDVLLLLPDDAPDQALDAGDAWHVGRDAGLVADVLSDREGDVLAAVDVPNTLAYVLPREGVRLG